MTEYVINVNHMLSNLEHMFIVSLPFVVSGRRVEDNFCKFEHIVFLEYEGVLQSAVVSLIGIWPRHFVDEYGRSGFAYFGIPSGGQGPLFNS